MRENTRFVVRWISGLCSFALSEMHGEVLQA